MCTTKGGDRECGARRTHSEGEDEAEDNCRQEDVQSKLLLEDVGHLLEQSQLYHPLKVDTSEAVMLPLELPHCTSALLQRERLVHLRNPWQLDDSPLLRGPT